MSDLSIVRRLGMGSLFCGFLLIVSVIGILWYTFIHTVVEADFIFGLPPWGIGGWGEYGRLWDWLNPFFYKQPFYAWNLLIVQVLVVLPQFWLVKKGRLSRNLVYFNIFTSFLFRAGYSAQDVTATVFAPLASINPIFTLFFIFQKFGIGWTWNLSDSHWLYMVYLTSFEPFVWAYELLMLWTFLPVIVWMRNTFFKDRFNMKPSKKLVVFPEQKDVKSALIEFVVIAYLSLIVFFAIDSFINGGYLLQICHPWQLGTKGFDQCTNLITLPTTGGWNYPVLVVMLAGSVVLGIIDVIVRLRR